MTLPNLAARPLLNTRPVWWLTASASLLAVVLLAVNVHLYATGSRRLAEQVARRAALVEQENRLARAAKRDVASLNKVPWRALEARVERINGILEGHAFSWLALLDDLGRVLPRQVRLYQISPRAGTNGFTLSLNGTARTREEMIAFLENLIADPRFFDPLPRSETSPDASESAGYGFRLRVGYRSRRGVEP